MASTEAVEFGLFRQTAEGIITETESIWSVYLSALGRTDASILREEHGITNAWFPFPKHTLRRLLNSRSDEAHFNEWQQDLILNTHWPEASPRELVHVALEDADDFMEVNRHFGHGAFGHVEQVTIPAESKEIVCVRKKIQRPKALNAQQKYFDALMREINVMRRLSHHHCVQLLGSYTDHDFMGILMLPVADMNLATFLDLPYRTDVQTQFLRRSIECLCSALCYLHQERIR